MIDPIVQAAETTRKSKKTTKERTTVTEPKTKAGWATEATGKKRLSYRVAWRNSEGVFSRVLAECLSALDAEMITDALNADAEARELATEQRRMKMLDFVIQAVYTLLLPILGFAVGFLAGRRNRKKSTREYTQPSQSAADFYQKTTTVADSSITQTWGCGTPRQ